MKLTYSLVIRRLQSVSRQDTELLFQNQIRSLKFTFPLCEHLIAHTNHVLSTFLSSPTPDIVVAGGVATWEEPGGVVTWE